MCVACRLVAYCLSYDACCAGTVVRPSRSLRCRSLKQTHLRRMRPFPNQPACSLVSCGCKIRSDKICCEVSCTATYAQYMPVREYPITRILYPRSITALGPPIVCYAEAEPRHAEPPHATVVLAVLHKKMILARTPRTPDVPTRRVAWPYIIKSAPSVLHILSLL